MNLIGEVTTGPFGAGEVLYIGDTPVADYFQQLNGKVVHVAYAFSEETPLSLADFHDNDPIEFVGKVEAGIEAVPIHSGDEADPEDIVQHFTIEESVLVGDRNLIEELYGCQDGFVVLVAEEGTIDFEDVLEPSIQKTNDVSVTDTILADVIFEIATNAPVLYLDDNYRVVRVGEEKRYYIIDNGRFIRIHESGPGGFKELLDRLLEKKNPGSGQKTASITETKGSNTITLNGIYTT